MGKSYPAQPWPQGSSCQESASFGLERGAYIEVSCERNLGSNLGLNPAIYLLCELGYLPFRSSFPRLQCGSVGLNIPTIGVPAVEQRDQPCLGSAGMQVQFLAWQSGLLNKL